MNTRRRTGASAALLALTAFACGGEPPPPAPAPVAETQGDEAPAPAEPVAANPDDDLSVEGILGAISEQSVRRGMEARQGRFLRCFGARYDANELLAGSFTFSGRIRTDGAVRWVYLAESDVGDRPTEACLVGVAEAARFTRPRGGEAEFRYAMAVDALERPAVDWPAERAAATVAEHGEGIGACNAAGVRVTAYVAPGGSVTTAGAAVDDPERQDVLDCVVTEVQAWTFPDPGSYPAKVGFTL